MSTIGPRFPPPNPPAPQGPGADGRSAAQRAFFAAALGQAPPRAQVQAPQTPTPPQTTAPATRVTPQAAPPAVQATRVQTTEIPQGEAPTRILRPGSIIDIRV